MNGPCVQLGVSLAEMILFAWISTWTLPTRNRWGSYPDVSCCLQEAANHERNKDPCSSADHLVEVEESDEKEEGSEDACGCN